MCIWEGKIILNAKLVLLWKRKKGKRQKKKKSIYIFGVAFGEMLPNGPVLIGASHFWDSQLVE